MHINMIRKVKKTLFFKIGSDKPNQMEIKCKAGFCSQQIGVPWDIEEVSK